MGDHWRPNDEAPLANARNAGNGFPRRLGWVAVQETEFEALTHVALFLADQGDGHLEDDELRVLIGGLSNVGHEHGLSPKAAVALATDVAQQFSAARQTKDLQALSQDFHDACVTLRDRVDDLSLLYRQLVQVAASDGELEQGEQQILAHVRKTWRLDA